MKTKLHHRFWVCCLIVLWASTWPAHAFYNPQTGHWLSREPLGEAASYNLVSLAENNPVNSYDVLGLYAPAGHYYTTYLVARAAGISPGQAFRLAYWSQYPDLDPNYDAIKAPLKDLYDVQEFLHSLTGGDAVKLRKYLDCLIKSGSLSPGEINELGVLIHPRGDASAHASPDSNDPNRWLGTPKQRMPNPTGIPEKKSFINFR